MPLHIFDETDDNIRVVEPDHTSGDAADRTYTIESTVDVNSMAFDGTNLHAADITNDNIRVIAPDTADGHEPQHAL